MTWDEWEQAKAESSAADPIRTRLNQLPAQGGASTGDLVVHDDELGKLGDLARSLRQQLSADGDHARTATFEAANDLFNGGLEMGGALLEVHDAWLTKLGTLKEACGHISNHLDHSRSTQGAQERKIVTGMQSLDGGLMTVSRINQQYT